ncbi:MAG: twin-arginine translocase TatA/TatE family subunit [Pseudomonadota bacterium]
MAVGWQQLLIVLVIVLVLFGGRGRISSIMGDMAKGIKSFKKGLADDDEETKAAKRDDASLSHEEPAAASTTDSSEKTKA